MNPAGGADECIRNLEVYQKRVLMAMAGAADEIATLLENYAKGNHPWTPRTGATDVSTRGDVQRLSDDVFRIVLSAGMKYDVFLELAHEGRWAWLWPAVEANQQNILRILENHMGGLQ